ncbi:MAG: ligase-associated DNA damage response endonuclease PdeM [Verrucomicrobiota bacterium]
MSLPQPHFSCPTLTLGGEELWLLGERALYWPSQKALIFSDVHLGKAGFFQNQGMPVPEGSTKRDLILLTQLVVRHSARRLLVVGDLFHDSPQDDAELHAAFLRWRSLHCHLAIDLVRGNHDRRLPNDLGIEVHPQSLQLAGLHFLHDPAQAGQGEFLISGHLHPVVRLRPGNDPSLRLPCFWLEEERHLHLPAFGSFTGGRRVLSDKGDRVYAIADEKVVLLPPRLHAK